MNIGTGLLTGLSGLVLAALGLLLAFFAGLRLLFLIRKPGKGRIARGIAAAGLVLILCGAVLLACEELYVFRQFTDQVAWLLNAVALSLAAFLGVRAGRRRGRAEPAPPSVPGEGEAAIQEQERPPAGA